MKQRIPLFSKIRDLISRRKNRNTKQDELTESASKKIQKMSNAKYRSMRAKTPRQRSMLRQVDIAPRRGWWQMLIEISAFIAIPSVLLYVLGVVSFWLRIANEYDSISLSTTWYAASLVPRSSAAASGIEVIFRGLVYGTIIASGFLLLTHVIAYVRANRSGLLTRRFFSSSLLLPFWLFLSGLMMITLIRLLNENGSYAILYTFRLYALWFFLALAPPILAIAFGDQEGKTVFEEMVFSYPKSVYQVIPIIVVASMLVSILFPRESSLPCLWKEDTDGEVIEANVPNTQSSSEPVEWTLQGGFLSKNEGTWYVLTEADRLQAIPDDQSIRIVSGEFSVRYSRIGAEGLPAGESVAEKDMESGEAYVAVENCSSFPSQPTTYRF